MSPVVWLYAGFGAFVLVVMLIDLAITRNGEEVTIKRALGWTGVCVTLALGFVPVLFWMFDQHVLGLGTAIDSEGHTVVERDGARAAAEYFQGWLLEYALSVDNLFVFALIFTKFGVPKQYQHRVLTWGIIATLILRGVMILGGSLLINQFHWILYIAGAFLLYTAFKMLVSKEDEEFDIDKSRIVRVVRKVLPLTSEYHGQQFFVNNGARLVATPLFLVLVVLNLVDIVFAVDSIPAIFGVTRDSFVVFTSNVFAVLGLRALYFVLAQMMDQFRYLKVSLAVVLGFIGVKMLTEHWVEAVVPRATLTFISLGFIAASISLGIYFSMRHAPAKEQTPLAPMGEKDAT